MVDQETGILKNRRSKLDFLIPCINLISTVRGFNIYFMWVHKHGSLIQKPSLNLDRVRKD